MTAITSLLRHFFYYRNPAHTRIQDGVPMVCWGWQDHKEWLPRIPAFWLLAAVAIWPLFSWTSIVKVDQPAAFAAPRDRIIWEERTPFERLFGLSGSHCFVTHETGFLVKHGRIEGGRPNGYWRVWSGAGTTWEIKYEGGFSEQIAGQGAARATQYFEFRPRDAVPHFASDLYPGDPPNIKDFKGRWRPLWKG